MVGRRAGVRALSTKVKKETPVKHAIAQIEAVKDLIQEAVDKGATSVEQIHRTIADLPLSALEQRGLLGAEGKSARTLVDTSIGAVYQTIRTVNRQVGELASDLFEALENHSDAQAHIRGSKARRAKSKPAR
ncbi:MAG: hypothetical protein SF182_11475 [Deltaproteobacteria bacterium]|nr:hypothetical protein [Deltaproteobacteria bacterium]